MINTGSTIHWTGHIGGDKKHTVVQNFYLRQAWTLLMLKKLLLIKEMGNIPLCM